MGGTLAAVCLLQGTQSTRASAACKVNCYLAAMTLIRLQHTLSVTASSF